MTNGPYIVDETCLVFAKNIEAENDRLRAENEKLRAALKPFAGFYLNSSPCTDEAVICEAEEDGDHNLLQGDLREAYEAWRESGE